MHDASSFLFIKNSFILDAAYPFLILEANIIIFHEFRLHFLDEVHLFIAKLHDEMIFMWIQSSVTC